MCGGLLYLVLWQAVAMCLNMVLNSFMYNIIYSEITNMKVFLNFILSHKNRSGIVESQNRISYVKLSSELLVSIVVSRALL